MQTPNHTRLTSCIIAALMVAIVVHAQSLRVATYNILNFPEAMGMQRLDDLRTVIDYMNPDVLMVQEMQSQNGVELFLDSVMNYYENEYRAAPFHDGPDTDNALFYRYARADLVRSTYLPTINRDIMEYALVLTDANKELLLYSLHLKASQGYENEIIRLQEATVLRAHLDSLNAGKDFVVAGDFNLYTSSEPAYVMMTDSSTNGQVFDPLQTPGEWHENYEFAHLHTQSSRVQQLPDNGSTGGLDDRFDLILCSSALLDSVDLFIPVRTYTVFGNDGDHFNDAVNQGYNPSVPDHVADALYYASDHLPVSVDIIYGHTAQQAQEKIKICPNPMRTNAQLHMPWTEDFQKAEITITNILGQRVFACALYSLQSVALERQNMPVGIYFVHVKIYTQFRIHTYDAKLAVIE